MKTSLEKLSEFCITLENQNQKKSEKKNSDLIEDIKIHEEGGQPLWKTVKHTVL